MIPKKATPVFLILLFISTLYVIYEFYNYGFSKRYGIYTTISSDDDFDYAITLCSSVRYNRNLPDDLDLIVVTRIELDNDKNKQLRCCFENIIYSTEPLNADVIRYKQVVLISPNHIIKNLDAIYSLLKTDFGVNRITKDGDFFLFTPHYRVFGDKLSDKYSLEWVDEQNEEVYAIRFNETKSEEWNKYFNISNMLNYLC
jgi:hypothetical protein